MAESAEASAATAAADADAIPQQQQQQERGSPTAAQQAAAQLPIASHRHQLVEALRRNRVLVVLGETGSGKTTQLPQYVLDAPELLRPAPQPQPVAGPEGSRPDQGPTPARALLPIVVTQPRRLAAMSVAERVAQERGVRLGGQVGYHVRFDDCSGPATMIKYVTDGVLLRECLLDPSLSAYSMVVLDEAHIRSLQTDILFGLLKARVAKAKKGPRLVIMSATLHSEKFQTFFGCEKFEIPGRSYPVSLTYCNMITTENYTGFDLRCVEVAMQLHKTKPAGDILIFLTGRGEIEKVVNELYKQSEDLHYESEVADPTIEALMVLPVYGTMVSKAQQQIFLKAPPGVRKIVVATDIASTSLTIDGIVYVVDSGFVKQKIYNPRTGLDALKIVPISKAEAEQRRGRAGRTQPGECYRIYDRDFVEHMPVHTVPEIQRSSLDDVVLTLKCLGIEDVVHFDYLDPPEQYLLLEALRRLYFFDALDRHGQVTVAGQLMAQFPLSPSLSRVLLFSLETSMPKPWVKDLLGVVAMLSGEDPFVRPRREEEQQRAADVRSEIIRRAGDDFCTLLFVLRSYQASTEQNEWCRRNFLHRRVLATATLVEDQLSHLLEAAAESELGKEFVKLSKKQATFATAKPLPQPWHRISTREDLLPPIDVDTQHALRQALCAGLFHNVAQAAEGQNHFRTMEGQASVVLVHPSSAYFGEAQKTLKWVVYFEVVWTSQPFMHLICPIRYEWVKFLLPKLRQVDVRALSTTGKIDAVTLADADQQARAKSADEVAAQEVKRRNTSSDVDAARARFLERKRAKMGQ